MGRPWVGHSAWRVVECAEGVTGEHLGHLLTDADSDQLSRTREAQIAVFLSSLMAWDAVRDRLEPAAFAGHSLGQITALVAAGALTLEDGIRFVAARAEVTQTCADEHPGRMAAILGGNDGIGDAACEAASGAWPANDNAPGQVVIGGTAEGVDTAADHAKRLGARKVVPLDVGGAFHTPLMAPARAALSRHVEAIAFEQPTAPVVCNTDATPLAGNDGDEWRRRLADHVSVPVRWRGTTERLAASGVDTFVEIGHGTMLAGLVRRTVPGVATKGVAGPDDAAALESAA